MRRSLALNALLSCALLVGWTGTALASAGRPINLDFGKLVAYRGYRIVVPASWPVYDLSLRPAVCVRFDRHAVYLGRPSPVQRCPAHVVGRTEAILIEPLAARGAGAGAVAGSQAPLPAVTIRGAQPRQGSSARLVIASSGVIVTATWGRDPSTVERALGIRSLAALRARGVSVPGAAVGGARAAGAVAGTVYTGLGFDPCSAPSGSWMSAWRASPYHAVGIYIGGTNLGCAQPNLSAGWVSAESAAGWHLIPTYVGLQAPDNGCGCSSIDPSQASGEGAAAASDAVVQARSFGIGPGNPIYDDMEYYPRGGADTSAVLSFLSAWTSTLHSYGYKSGVYGNADSAISDLVAVVGRGFAEPDEIWIADWNGQQTTSDPYVPAGEWSDHQRLHQYSGGADETYRGVTINIDGDYLDGATAGGAGAPGPQIPDGTFVQVAGSSATYRIAGGAPLLVSDWSAFGGPQPVTVISEQQFSTLADVPRDGTFLETSGGAEYRVAGGAPLYVSNPALFATARPVVIDQWDIDNITNPAAHLNPVPANGTFLTTTGGQVYRVVGGAPFAVSNWAVFGGPRASVTIDGWDIANLANPAAHLSGTPADGTVVQGVPSDTYWLFTGGLRKLTSASGAAVGVDDLGLAAFPGIPCLVPSLRHTTLLQASRALRLADCRLGKVHLPKRPPAGHTLRVVKQSPHGGSSHTPGDKVTVTLA